MQDAAQASEGVSTAGAEVQSAVTPWKAAERRHRARGDSDTAAPQPASPATDPAPIAPVALQTEPAPPTVPSTPDPHSPAAPTAAPAPSADRPEQSSLFPENTIR
jgi:hypothetical protein